MDYSAVHYSSSWETSIIKHRKGFDVTSDKMGCILVSERKPADGLMLLLTVGAIHLLAVGIAGMGAA